MLPTHRIDGRDHRVLPLRRGTCQRLEIDGSPLEASLRWTGEHQGVLTVNGREHPVAAAQDGPVVFVHLAGRTWRIESIQGFAGRTEGGGADGGIRAPMPGVAVEIEVGVGDQVAANQRLALIESMKMQTEITAPVSGVVAAVRVAPGDSFDRGAVLIELEPSAECAE